MNKCWFLGAVEACLLHGLKKRALGLFKHSTTTALLQKVSKSFEPAALVLKQLNEDSIKNKSTDSIASRLVFIITHNTNMFTVGPHLSGHLHPQDGCLDNWISE